MARNWLRKCTLTLSGSSTAVISGGGQTDLRIVFAIKQWHLQAPNQASFRVYNPSQSTAAKLKAKEFAIVEFAAGYEDHIGTVFKGNIIQTRSGHETAVDSFVDIFAADSDTTYNQARVTKTLAAGYTPQDRLQVALDAMKPFGVTLGLNSLDLSQPKYPRGLPMIGMARDVIRQIVLSKNGLWSMQMGKVKITPANLDGADGGTIEMNGRTGMVGWPEQTADGILVRSLINPALQPLAKIKLDPSLILEAERDNNPFSKDAGFTNQYLSDQNVAAGTYTIFHMDRHGDTRGADWIDESLCLGAGGKPTQFMLANNYYVGPS